MGLADQTTIILTHAHIQPLKMFNQLDMLMYLSFICTHSDCWYIR